MTTDDLFKQFLEQQTKMIETFVAAHKRMVDNFTKEFAKIQDQERKGKAPVEDVVLIPDALDVTPKKKANPKKKVPPPSPADSVTERALFQPTVKPSLDQTRSTKQDVIGHLLSLSKCKRKAGETNEATELLKSTGSTRKWSQAHMYQIKHSMKHGSIKLRKELGTSLGADNQLEGKTLDPYDHESVKTYITAVSTVPPNDTLGRGYLRAALTTLDEIHKRM